MKETFKELRERGFNYFVGALGPLQENGTAHLYHIAGYPEPPTQKDIDSLIEELSTDEELRMTGYTYNEDFVLMPVDESTFEE